MAPGRACAAANYFAQRIVDGLRLTECDDSGISRHGVSLLSGGSGRLDTRLDTPPIKDACGATVTAEEMRAKALDCEEKSQTGTAELRNLYSVLAREWRRMADLIESAAEEWP